MTGKLGDIEFAAARFPEHASAIWSLGENEDFRELCEHLVLMCRLECEADGVTDTRFSELRKALEDELLDWVRRNPSTHFRRTKLHETKN